MDVLILFYNNKAYDAFDSKSIRGKFGQNAMSFNLSNRVMFDFKRIKTLKEFLNTKKINQTNLIIVRDQLLFMEKGDGEVIEIEENVTTFNSWVNDLKQLSDGLDHDSNVYVVFHHGDERVKGLKAKDNPYKLASLKEIFGDHLRSSCARSSNETSIVEFLNQLIAYFKDKEPIEEKFEQYINEFIKNTFREGLNETLKLLHFYHLKSFKTKAKLEEPLIKFRTQLSHFKYLMPLEKKQLENKLDETLTNYSSKINSEAGFIYNHKDFQKFSEEIKAAIVSYKIIDR